MIKRLFRQMLATQILSAMTVTVCMLIDSIMIGRYLGVDSMTAYGLAMPLLLIFSAFGSTMSAGIQVLCGHSVSDADQKGVNACFSASLVLTALFAGAGLLIIYLFSNPICTLLGAGSPAPDNHVFFLTRDYIRGFLIGAPAFLLAQIMVPYMQIAGKRTRLAIAVVLMTVSNILFNSLNVFVFRGGTFGMGLASGLSYYVAVISAFDVFITKRSAFRFRLRSVTKKTCVELLRGGLPTVVNHASLVFLIFVINNVLLSVGKNSAVAAYSVITSVGNICYCFGAGIGSVALLLSAIFYADEDKTSLRKLVRVMIYYAVVLDLVLTGLILLLAPELASLFLTDSADAVRMATLGVRLFSLSLLPSALNTAFKNYFQGIGNTALSKWISFFQNFLFTALFAILFSRFFKTTGVWMAYVCGESLTFLVISLVVWKQNGAVAFHAKAYSFLPHGFGVPDEDCLEMTVKSVKDPHRASEKALTFCRMHGESEDRAQQVAHCISEMTQNVIKHGFFKDRRSCRMEIRLILKGGECIIRLRDNCKDFNPIRYFERYKSNADTDLGILGVMKTVKSANYINSLGWNNLTLTL